MPAETLSDGKKRKSKKNRLRVRRVVDPKGSRGEGAVLLPGGHLLVAKEKKPPVMPEPGCSWLSHKPAIFPREPAVRVVLASPISKPSRRLRERADPTLCLVAVQLIAALYVDAAVPEPRNRRIDLTVIQGLQDFF